jgi:hypothetical protein
MYIEHKPNSVAPTGDTPCMDISVAGTNYNNHPGALPRKTKFLTFRSCVPATKVTTVQYYNTTSHPPRSRSAAISNTMEEKRKRSVGEKGYFQMPLERYVYQVAEKKMKMKRK